MTATAGPPAVPPTVASRMVLPALLVVAAALRMAWWAGYVDVIENEGVEYTRLAWNWFHGQGYVSIFGGTHTLFPPFYPLLIGVLAPLAGSEEAAARLVSLLAGLALVAAVHGLALSIVAAAAPAVVVVEELSSTGAPGIRTAGAWVRQDHARSPDPARRPLIAGVGLAIGHYAEGRITYLPHADEARALRYLRRTDPDYLALRYSEVLRLPYAAAWLRRGPATACAAPVEDLPADAAAAIRLWRWTCDPVLDSTGATAGLEPPAAPARNREDG